MNRAETEALIERIYAARVAGNMEVLRQTFADGVTLHVVGSPEASPMPMLIIGHSAVMSEFEHMIATFALSDLTFLDVLIDGDEAAVRWRATVRLISTGQTFTTELAHFLRFEAGKVVSMTGFVDTALTRQILSGSP